MSHSLYGGSGHKITETAFVKLNKKRTTTKGLGHSSMNKNNFDRRNSTTTTVVSTQEKASTCAASEGRSLTQPLSRTQLHHEHHYHHLQCNGFKGQFDFTEQRCNYERISGQLQQQQQQKQFQQFDRQMWPSELVSKCDIIQSRLPSCSISNISSNSNSKSINSDNNLHDSEVVDSQFLALQEFRIQNSHECFGSGRLLDVQQQQLSANFIPSPSVIFSPREVDTTATPMPYALRQNLLRSKMAKELKNRKAKKEFLNSGLNKSCALSYQPMY